MNNKKAALVPFFTIFLLMCIAYALTFIFECEGISFIQWIASPILVLGSESGGTTIAVLFLLVVLGGTSNVLEQCGFLEYMLRKIAKKYASKRYLFICILCFFMMICGSFVGSFEEVIPMIPLAVVLARNFGFDDLTGIAISLLAVGCGFSAGVANPFTIGVAQTIANLPMYSGFGFRLISFFLIYILLMVFVINYAKKIAKPVDETQFADFVEESSKEKALIAFASIMGVCIAINLCSSFLTFLQDFTLIIMSLGYLFGCITATIIAKVPAKQFGKYFYEGLKEIFPSIILILMANSIKCIMDASGVLNSILQLITAQTASMNKMVLIMFIYLICLVLEFFVSSGSAKAFLLMPLLVPIAQTSGLNPQLLILAYAFGDGFSNVIYPTNVGLLIGLSLAKVEYKDWFKYSWKFQLANFVLTCVILYAGLLFWV